MHSEPIIIDFAHLYANTSGASPIADHVGDEWTVPHKIFVEVWGWTLWNNGLVITEPITLN